MDSCPFSRIKQFFLSGLLAHMDQMRMDPKHQFAAQYVLSRAANERREREALLAAAAMNMSHLVNNISIVKRIVLHCNWGG
jgi:hypothetical protein